MKNFTTAFTTALIARNAVAPSKDIITAINNAKRYEKALDDVFASTAFTPVAANLLKRVAIADRNQDRDGFIAVKVLVKIVSTCVAIAQKNNALIDPYSDTIIKNLIGLQQINNRDCLVSLSRSQSYSEQDATKALISRYNCSAGTASTQMSSTRMTLEVLDICEIIKRKQNDAIQFKDNDRATAMKRVYVSASDLPAVVVDKLESELQSIDNAASEAQALKAEKATGEAQAKPAKKAPAKRAPKAKPATVEAKPAQDSAQ